MPYEVVMGHVMGFGPQSQSVDKLRLEWPEC